MEDEFPRHLFQAGYEPQVEKINNNCKISVLKKLKAILPAEYNTVKSNSVFSQVLTLFENGLGYSAKLIHSMLCRELVTEKKHELWFVFGGKPLRFSFQEFYAVTGLKYQYDNEVRNSAKWKDDTDKGFWRKLLMTGGGQINMRTLLGKEQLGRAKKWLPVDKVRFVYICVIASVIMGQDDKKDIPHKYIELAMDARKVQTYPWGLEAFDLLVSSIIKTRVKLTRKLSYTLDGFSFTFQIWIMEAIPIVGALLGEKLNKDFIEIPRCSNWRGAARVSYEDIIQLENTLEINDSVYAYISSTGNFDVFEWADFIWDDEEEDVRVNNLTSKIRAGNDFSDHIWEFVEYVEPAESVDEQGGVQVDNENVQDENVSVASGSEASCQDDILVSAKAGSRRGKKKLPDHGAETRKKKILCERAAARQERLSEDTKSFIKELLLASFSTLQEKLEKTIDLRLGKIENDLSELKDSISTAANTRNAEPSTRPLAQHSLDDVSMDDVDIIFSQSSPIDLNVGTQEYLQKTMGKLYEESDFTGFSTQTWESNEISHFSTPHTSFVEPVWFGPVQIEKPGIPMLFTDTNLTDNKRGKDKDDPLVFVSEKSFNDLMDWSKKHQKLKVGPTIINQKLLDRVIGPKNWLQNEEVDAIMYVFRENTTLGRWKQARVAFMNCWFSMQITNEFSKFVKDRRKYKFSDLLLAYGKGELPSHGMTMKLWAMDVDRIYVPLNVNKNHWISLCINFVHRSIEVFDCAGNDNRRNVEPFAVIVPRIVKAVQSTSVGKQLNVAQYTIINTPVQRGLNKSDCDCGVYALKHIECHLLGLDLSTINDDNIGEARIKIAVDMWQAANDTVLMHRMSLHQPTIYDSTFVE